MFWPTQGLLITGPQRSVLSFYNEHQTNPSVSPCWILVRCILFFPKLEYLSGSSRHRIILFGGGEYVRSYVSICSILNFLICMVKLRYTGKIQALDMWSMIGACLCLSGCTSVNLKQHIQLRKKCSFSTSYHQSAFFLFSHLTRHGGNTGTCQYWLLQVLLC